MLSVDLDLEVIEEPLSHPSNGRHRVPDSRVIPSLVQFPQYQKVKHLRLESVKGTMVRAKRPPLLCTKSSARRASRGTPVLLGRARGGRGALRDFRRRERASPLLRQLTRLADTGPSDALHRPQTVVLSRRLGCQGDARRLHG